MSNNTLNFIAMQKKKMPNKHKQLAKKKKKNMD